MKLNKPKEMIWMKRPRRITAVAPVLWPVTPRPTGEPCTAKERMSPRTKAHVSESFSAARGRMR